MPQFSAMNPFIAPNQELFLFTKYLIIQNEFQVFYQINLSDFFETCFSWVALVALQEKAIDIL